MQKLPQPIKNSFNFVRIAVSSLLTEGLTWIKNILTYLIHMFYNQNGFFLNQKAYGSFSDYFLIKSLLK